MPSPMEFYFDFSSPYAYFASLTVDGIGARFGRAVKWKPVMIGSAFRASGNKPLIEQPLKGAYSRHDWARIARRMDVPYAFPDPFPVGTQSPARAFYWLEDGDPALARRFAAAIFHGYFGQGRNVSQPEVVAEIAAALGIDTAALLDAMGSPQIKDRLKDETAAAIGKSVFGSPFFIIDGEGFWGWDRLPMVEEWLERGGW